MKLKLITTIPKRLTLLLTVCCFAVIGQAEEDDASVLASFIERIEKSDGLDVETREEALKIIEEYGVDAASDAITEALIVIHDGYAAAVEASDGEDLDAIVEILTPFSESNDKFLAADATFYLARSLMNNEKFEAAYPLLQKVHGELSDFNVHVGKARFYFGVAQAGLLQYANAIQTLMDFTQFYPDAPERLRVAAWRQIQQLRTIKEGQMADVYQRMDFSRRKLSLIEPGEETQKEQKKIVNMLAKLIKQQEKKEASSSSSSKNQKNTKQKKQQKPKPASKNQQQNKSQSGGSSSNSNGKVVKKSYDSGPASPWSRLRDRSRDPANNAIKDKLPARYRDIVERYYEAANGDSKK